MNTSAVDHLDMNAKRFFDIQAFYLILCSIILFQTFVCDIYAMIHYLPIILYIYVDFSWSICNF